MATGKPESSAWAICIDKTGLKPHKSKDKKETAYIVAAIGKSLTKHRRGSKNNEDV